MVSAGRPQTVRTEAYGFRFLGDKTPAYGPTAK